MISKQEKIGQRAVVYNRSALGCKKGIEREAFRPNGKLKLIYEKIRLTITKKGMKRKMTSMLI